jgi:hypothetical protein
MPVIDFHVHLARYQSMTQSYLDLIRRQWGDRWEEMSERFSRPEVFLKLMDECGIDYAVILA